MLYFSNAYGRLPHSSSSTLNTTHDSIAVLPSLLLITLFWRAPLASSFSQDPLATPHHLTYANTERELHPYRQTIAVMTLITAITPIVIMTALDSNAANTRHPHRGHQTPHPDPARHITASPPPPAIAHASIDRTRHESSYPTSTRPPRRFTQPVHPGITRSVFKESPLRAGVRRGDAGLLTSRIRGNTLTFKGCCN